MYRIVKPLMITVLGLQDQVDYLVDKGYIFLKDGNIWFEDANGKLIETIMMTNYIAFGCRRSTL